MINLHQLRILVTRPEPQGNELCMLIKQLGGHPIHLPTIAFAPPPDQKALQHGIQKLGDQDWLIFISPQAVYAAVPAIRKQWPVLPPQVKFAAVGAGTAKALHEAGYNVAAFPLEEASSEALLDMPEFQDLHGKKVAIIQGVGGRDYLATTLVERSAKVLPIYAYQRQLPTHDMTPYEKMLSEQAIDVIVCTSFEGVQNLLLLFKEQERPHLNKVPLVVVSERIKELAHELGFQRIEVAHHAGHKAILETLASV